jgi:methylmalonyl-CoA mutase C-terminal domain/subunit
VQEDVDAVGISILSGAHLTLFPAIIEQLRARGADELVVFGGGIVPEEDMEKLKQAGVAAIFTPGASTEDIAEWVHEHIKPRQ